MIELIKIKIGKNSIELSLDDAVELYQDLKTFFAFFEKKPVHHCDPGKDIYGNLYNHSSKIFYRTEKE